MYEKSGQVNINCHDDPAVWVHPGEIIAVEICSNFNKGLVRVSGEVKQRFNAVFSRFELTKGPI